MNRRLSSLALVAAGLSAWAGLVPIAPAAEDEAALAPRNELLAAMRGLAEQTKVTLPDSDHPPKLVASPVFRYDDQPRRILDATLWVWTADGRPVLFEKIEAIDRGSPRWSHCCTSFSTGLVTVEWPHNHRLQTTEAGVTFRPVADAPAVAARSTQRKRQMRELARQFSARIVVEDVSTAEMRLLTTPIYEYTDSKSGLAAGAVFGFGTNGTNPDLLLAIEARSDRDAVRWSYASARITTNGIRLWHLDQQVWEVHQVNYKQAPFANWTCFGIPRPDLKPDPEP
jgi:hypothetical protein